MARPCKTLHLWDATEKKNFRISSRTICAITGLKVILRASHRGLHMKLVNPKRNKKLKDFQKFMLLHRSHCWLYCTFYNKVKGNEGYFKFEIPKNGIDFRIRFLNNLEACSEIEIARDRFKDCLV